MDGALAVTTNDEGQWLVENLPRCTLRRDKYYLASYRVELADLYREENANLADGTTNQWMLTRYHNDATEPDARGPPAVKPR